jgi:acyl-CoA synthetase (AMP-forming)/AMP-acid ligase II
VSVGLAEIHARVEMAAAQGRTYIVTETGSVSFATVSKAACDFAAILLDAGLNPKGRIALSGDLGPGVLAALWLAALRLGLTCLFIPAPVNRDAALIFNAENRVDGLFMSGGNEVALIVGLPNLAKISLGDAPARNLTTPAPVEKPANTVFFTSGSTGAPKGVHLGQQGLARHLSLYAQLLGYNDPATVLLNGLPLHHTDGSFHGLMMALWTGATWLCPPAFQVQNVARLAAFSRQHRATHLIGNPTLLSMVLTAFPGAQPIDFGPLRGIISSAERLTLALWDEVEARFGANVTNIYGMSETTNGGFFARPADRPASRGTVGQAYDIEYEIRLENGSLAAVGQEGRLFLRGQSLFLGYERCGQTEYQRGAFEWFDTCDRAVLDGDNNLSILGRLDGQINLGGYLMSPDAIAQAVTDLGLFDRVQVEILDEAPARPVPVAFVVPLPGMPESDLAVFAHLPVELRPRHIVTLPPKSYSAALSKAQCQSLFAEHRIPLVAATATDQVVLACAARAFRCRPDQLSRELKQSDTAGWDSFAFVELIMETEAALDISFTGQDLAGILTLGDLMVCAQVRRKAATGFATPTTPLQDTTPNIETILPKIAMLTRQWKGAPVDPLGTIRLYHRDGTRRPLIWCFNSNKEADALAAELDPDQPLIAMRSLNQVVEPEMRERSFILDALADYYAAQLLERLFLETCILGGNCMSAQIAYRIGLRLMRAGVRIERFVMIDKSWHLPLPLPVRMLFGDKGRDNPNHLPAAQQARYHQFWAAAFPRYQTLEMPGKHGSYFQPERAGTTARLILQDDPAAPLPLPQSAPPVVWQTNKKDGGQICLILPDDLPHRASDYDLAPIFHHAGATPILPLAWADHAQPITLPDGRCGFLITPPAHPGPWHLRPILLQRGQGPVTWPLDQQQAMAV